MPATIEVSKENAAITFAHVVDETSKFFPEEKYRPSLIKQRTVNSQYGIDPGEHKLSINGDGTGTKPELAERLFDMTDDYSHFKLPASDVVAMVADDAARFGYFVVGILNSLDVNTAKDPQFVTALAEGMADACRKGGFPLLNGETAELGYRCPGWGKHRLNWNAGALTLINQDKLITGEHLAPGQTIVAFQEETIRSNGLSMARRIMERAYMMRTHNMKDRGQFIARATRLKFQETFNGPGFENINDSIVMKILSSTPMEENLWEQIQVPWHLGFEDLTKKLIKPSTIYAPVIHDALGGVDGKIQVPIVACAHISGGGIPLKVGRMLEKTGLGCQIDAVFPDPAGIEELIDLAQQYPNDDGTPMVDGRRASEEWNRGTGLVCVTKDDAAARYLIDIAASKGRKAAIAGKVISEKEIRWRGESWNNY